MKLRAPVRRVAARFFMIAALGITVAAGPAGPAGPAGTAVARGPTVAEAAGAATPTGAPVGGSLLGSWGLVLPIGAPAPPPGLSASSWLLADLDTGAVLAARDPHGRFAPASTLKILTAATLIPKLDPRATIVVTDSDVRVDGTKVGLVPKLRVHISTLFAALLVVSANDAALALGRAAGGVPATVRAMNAEARHLGAFDTVAATVHGLDAPGQVSSAYDLALIARSAMRLAAFRHYVTIRRAQFPAPHGKSFQIYTHDKLLIHYPGAIGIKNGFTDAAGSSFVGAARRGGHTLLVALLHAKPTVWREAAALLTWGFAGERRMAPVGRLVTPGEVATPAGASAGPPANAPAAPPAAGSRAATAAPPTGSGSVATGARIAAAALLVAAAALLAAAVRRRVVRRRVST